MKGTCPRRNWLHQRSNGWSASGTLLRTLLSQNKFSETSWNTYPMKTCSAMIILKIHVKFDLSKRSIQVKGVLDILGSKYILNLSHFKTIPTQKKIPNLKTQLLSLRSKFSLYTNPSLKDLEAPKRGSILQVSTQFRG